MLELDHIAVLGETLEEAVVHTEQVLGHPMMPGGTHERFGTHNQLLGLAPQLYLEAIATDPGAPPPPDARWFGLDSFAGPARLDKWICRVNDLDAALEALPMAGHRIELSRGTLRWAMAVPEDGQLPFDGLFPALIQWHTEVPPGKAMASGSLELKRLTVNHPRATELQALLGTLLKAPLVSIKPAERPSLSAQILVEGQEVTL